MATGTASPGSSRWGERLRDRRRRRRHEAASHPMVRYLLRRVGAGLLVIVLVALTVFVVTRVATDPARQMLPINAGPQQYEALQRSLGLDQPVLTQLGTYLGDLASFDLGISYWQKVPVSDLVFDRLLNTALLAVIALTFALVIAVPLGIGASLRPGSWLDHVLSVFALVGLSMPQFWLGAMLIFVFAVSLGWLPTSGIGGIDHVILPAIALAVPTLGRVAQITRTTMIDELSSQHVLVARAKGLSSGYVVMRHALRNVLVPILTIFSWETAYILAGEAVLVETVFGWPGIGYLATQAIRREDLILLQGIVIVVAVIVVVINIITDILYTRIDPRIELK